MKKLANILLIFVMCFVLVGCGKDKKLSNDDETKEENTKAELESAVTKTIIVVNTVKYNYMAALTSGKDFPLGIEQDATLLDLEFPPTAGTYTVTSNNLETIVTANGLIFGNYSCDFDQKSGADCKKRD